MVGPEYGALCPRVVLFNADSLHLDTTFTSWLFDEVAKISGSTPDAAFDSKSAQPDSQLCVHSCRRQRKVNVFSLSLLDEPLLATLVC